MQQAKIIAIPNITDHPPTSSYYINLFHIPCIPLSPQVTEETHLNIGVVLGGDVLDRNLNVLLGKVHFSSKSAVWLPLARGAGGALLQHLVDLLESKTLGLGNEEVGKED
jgi:hypothetical protein